MVADFICRSCIHLPKRNLLVLSAYSIDLEAEFIPNGRSFV